MARIRNALPSKRTIGAVSPGSVGAAHELLVCADVLKRGWTVYRNVSPHGDADLVIAKGETMLRVEVTTAVRYHTGTVNYPPKDAHKHDLLVLVFHDGTIEYRPALPVAEGHGLAGGLR